MRGAHGRGLHVGTDLGDPPDGDRHGHRDRYLQQEILAGLHGKALTGTTAPSVQREYAQLAGAMRQLARDRVVAHHFYGARRSPKKPDQDVSQAIELEFQDALRLYQSSLNSALAIFDRSATAR